VTGAAVSVRVSPWRHVRHGVRVCYDVLPVSAPARPSRAIRRLAAFAAAVLLATPAVLAEPLTSIPNPRTRQGTWAADAAGRLRPGTIAQLSARISDVERVTGVEMAVVVHLTARMAGWLRP